MEFNLSEAPEIKLSYGMLQNEAEWKNWIKNNLENLINTLKPCSEADKKILLEKAATELFETIGQCGYEEGYDIANEDRMSLI